MAGVTCTSAPTVHRTHLVHGNIFSDGQHILCGDGGLGQQRFTHCLVRAVRVVMRYVALIHVHHKPLVKWNLTDLCVICRTVPILRRLLGDARELPALLRRAGKQTADSREHPKCLHVSTQACAHARTGTHAHMQANTCACGRTRCTRTTVEHQLSSLGV